MRTTKFLAGSLGFLIAGSALAQQGSVAASLGLFVYPSDGQSAETQRKDEQECYDWAREVTGINPSNPPASQRPASAAQEDTAQAAARSGTRAAARNVLIANATDNDWEQAAAVGLVFGSARGANNARRRNEQAQQEATAEQKAATEAQVQQFSKAFSACIEGRAYTIR